MVSTGTRPPHPAEQEPEPLAQQAPPLALPLEADPSGFTERAPALGSLLPDEALSRALAGGDALAVHAALVARASRERAGPTRATLKALLAQPALFAVSEAPPWRGGALGTGVSFVGLPPSPKQYEPFIATRALRLLGLPVWPLSQHLMRRGRDGELEVLGRVPNGLGLRVKRVLAGASAGLVVLAGMGLAATPFVMRELFLVNGLSQPVEVSVDGQRLQLAPGQMTQRWKFSVGRPYRVTAAFLGAPPFQELSVEPSQRAVYNVLGAASVAAREPQGLPSRQPLPGTVASLPEEKLLVVSPGGWQRRVQEQADQGAYREAAELALAVALVDPLDVRAREEFARHMLRLPYEEATGLVWKLHKRYPEDFAVSRLVQDALVTLGNEPQMLRYFSQPRYQDAKSVQDALLYARSRPPEEQRQAHAAVLERFPEAPEAQRALARLRLADGYAEGALKLLEAARSRAPESLEDLELRVRALVSLKQVREASGAVSEYARLPGRGSWELAVLGSRLARLAGPTRTQYVLEEVMTPGMLATPEAEVSFALLTGYAPVNPTQLSAVKEPVASEALELTRATLMNLQAAVVQAQGRKDPVLRRLPLEAAAVLALELSHLRQEEAADRLFYSHFALMHAREPLRTYVMRGELHPRFWLLAPELQAAAFLVRARAVQRDAFVQRAYARWTEVLGGFARRALDPKYEEPVEREVKLADGREQDGRDIIHIVHPGPRPEELGPRVPRPWR